MTINNNIYYFESLNDLVQKINSNYSTNTLVLIDQNLSLLNLQKSLNAKNILINVSETTKSLDTVNKIWQIFFECELDRTSDVLIIGGGVLLDLAGFAASTYKRGINFTYIPTTLLSIVDASHGGKNGFNNEFGKNQIGTFNLPKSVFVCFEFLNTLDENNYKNGLIELIKHGLIADEEIVLTMFSSTEYKVSYDLIKSGINVKTKIVNEDFLESNHRKYLNFGHTIGHLIEKDSKFQISHGQAVAIGMYYELLLSKIYFGLKDELINLYLKFLEKINFTYSYNFQKPKTELLQILKNDKKVINNNIEIVLISDIAKPKLMKLNLEKLIEVVYE